MQFTKIRGDLKSGRGWSRKYGYRVPTYFHVRYTRVAYDDIVPGTRLGLFHMTELQHMFDDIVAVPNFNVLADNALEGYG